MLAGIFRLAGRLPNRQVLFVRVTVAVGAVASLAWALYLRTDNLDRAYFGTDARAYQLLLGASIALVPGFISRLGRFRRTSRVAVAVTLAALLVLASSLTGLDAVVRGAAVAAVAALMIVALECSGEGFAKRVLSSGPMVYLGKVSYGTYLWHWPLIVLATETLELSPGVMAWSACLIATALASLSFQLLEHPVRKSRLIDRHRFVVIGTGLAISVVSALVLVPAIIDSGSSSGAAPRASTTEGFTPVPSSIDPKAIYLEGFGLPIKLYGKPTEPPDCVNAQPEQCTVVHGTGRHFLLMGDSNAEMMIPAFTKIARENNLTLSLSVKPGCPWQRDVYVNTKEIQDRCRAAKEDAYKRVIPALKPDVMILVTAGGWAGKNPPVTAIDKARTRSLLDATRKSLDALAEGDRDLVIMEPNPEPVTEINPRCVSRPRSGSRTAVTSRADDTSPVRGAHAPARQGQ